MTTEIIQVDLVKTACEINAIKRKTAQDMLTSAREIGRLLCDAKGQVPHGEWGVWLAENVGYSERNATNMMRVFREFEKIEAAGLPSEMDVFEGLNLSQALLLMSLPAAERQEFAEEHDLQGMTVQQMKEALKEREDALKQAEDDLKQVSEEAKEYARRADDAEGMLKEAQDGIRELEEALAEERQKAVPDTEVQKFKKELEAKYKAEAAANIEKAKKAAEKEAAKLKGDNEKAKKEAAEALEKEKERIQAEAKEAAEREMAAKIAEIEAKAKAAAIGSNPYLLRFREHYEALQREVACLSDIIAEAEREDPETAAKLSAIMMQIGVQKENRQTSADLKEGDADGQEAKSGS